MPDYQRSNRFTVSNVNAHIVWSTQFRCSVYQGDIKTRCLTILIKIGEAEDVVILTSVCLKIIFTYI